MNVILTLSSSSKVTRSKGKLIIVDCERAEVVHEEVEVAGEDGPNTLNYVHSEEGLITDLYVSRDEEYDHNLGTNSESLDEVVERLSDLK